MSKFPVYTIENAPAASRPALAQLQQAFGFVPNIAGAIAGAPTLIQGFIAVFQNAHAGTLGEAEIQVLLLTNAVTNASEWPVAFHTHLALENGVAVDDVNAIRHGLAPSKPAHAALSMLAKKLIERRGHLVDSEVEAFLAAGFKPEQVLEVILVVAASTITNHVAALAKPPLEAALQVHAWQSQVGGPKN
jgi:alkylhydroperoxidase family enzyme